MLTRVLKEEGPLTLLWRREALGHVPTAEICFCLLLFYYLIQQTEVTTKESNTISSPWVQGLTVIPQAVEILLVLILLINN